MGVMSTSVGNKDPSIVVMNVMREINKTNRMINKDDIWSVLSK
jgi:hypothetical protein